MATSTNTGNVDVVIKADLEYARVGDESLRLDLYAPGDAAWPLPTILYMHGGGFVVGDKSDMAVDRLVPLVDKGFAVASASYRLVPSAIWPAQLHDVKAAVRWLRANAGAHGLDPQRIAAAGVSAGGQ